MPAFMPLVWSRSIQVHCAVLLMLVSMSHFLSEMLQFWNDGNSLTFCHWPPGRLVVLASEEKNRGVVKDERESYKNITRIPIQTTNPAIISHPTKMSSIRPGDRHIRDANRVLRRFNLKERCLLVPVLSNLVICEASGGDVASSTAANILLILIVRQ